MPDLIRGKSAEVDPDLWDRWLNAKHLADQATEILNGYQDAILEQTGGAQYLTVNGVKVATRVVRKVENASWTDDHFRRVKQ